MRFFNLRHFLRRALRHDLSAVIARVRTEVNDPVCRFDHVEVVFDHDDRMACVHEPLKNFKQHPHVIEVQPGRGFVE